MRGSHSTEWRLSSTERGCTDGCLRILPLISQLRQDVFRFRSRNRRCSADEEKLRETLCVSCSRPSPRGLKNTHPPRRGDCRIARRVLAFPVGEGGTRSVTDEGLQAAGTAWCEVLLCTIPHQSLTAEDVFRFRNAKSSVFSRRRKTPRDALRLVQLSPKEAYAPLPYRFRQLHPHKNAVFTPQIPGKRCKKFDFVKQMFTFCAERRNCSLLCGTKNFRLF